MPELPEVETIKRDLEKKILQYRFRRVEVIDPFILRTPTAQFIQAFNDQSVRAVSRRGKALIIELSSGKFLIVQLMMTGQLVVDGVPDKHTHVIFHFIGDRTLLYNDQRKFGQLRMVNQLAEVKHFQLLGPEPFDQSFDAAYLFEHTRHSKRPVKTLLLDHTFVAGIGNIYACEILFRAKVSPTRLAGRLSLAQAKDIHHQIVEVLREAIAHRGSSMRNYRDASGQEGAFKKLIRVYAREGEPCVRCKSSIKRITQAGRSTFYCAKCQK